MRVTHNLRMDLARCGCRPIVGAVQGEANTRVLEVALYDNSVAWEIPQTAVVDIAYQKPDGTKGIYSRLPDGTPATTFSGNVLTAILAPQVLTCAGTIRAAFVFSKDGDETLATFPFTLTVEANPAAGAERSEDYFNPQDISDVRAELTAKIQAEMTAYGDQLEADFAVERARMDELVAMRGSSEVMTQSFDFDLGSCTFESNGYSVVVSLVLTNPELQSRQSVEVADVLDVFIPLHGVGESIPLFGFTEKHYMENACLHIDENKQMYLQNLTSDSVSLQSRYIATYPAKNTVIPELADMRVDISSKAHDSAGTAVRTKIQECYDAVGNMGTRITAVETDAWDNQTAILNHTGDHNDPHQTMELVKEYVQEALDPVQGNLGTLDENLAKHVEAEGNPHKTKVADIEGAVSQDQLQTVAAEISPIEEELEGLRRDAQGYEYDSAGEAVRASNTYFEEKIQTVQDNLDVFSETVGQLVNGPQYTLVETISTTREQQNIAIASTGLDCFALFVEIPASDYLAGACQITFAKKDATLWQPWVNNAVHASKATHFAVYGRNEKGIAFLEYTNATTTDTTGSKYVNRAPFFKEGNTPFTRVSLSKTNGFPVGTKVELWGIEG